MNPHSTELPTGTRIVLKDISMVYESLNGQIEALKKINLTVSENEFVAIVGPSGCGKTTLLRIAAQLIKPTRGQLFINGLNTEGTKPNLDIGYVFQDAALLNWRTVLQNVMLPIELAGNAGEDANTIALELIELVGLSGFATHF